MQVGSTHSLLRLCASQSTRACDSRPVLRTAALQDPLPQNPIPGCSSVAPRALSDGQLLDAAKDKKRHCPIPSAAVLTKSSVPRAAGTDKRASSRERCAVGAETAASTWLQEAGLLGAATCCRRGRPPAGRSRHNAAATAAAAAAYLRREAAEDLWLLLTSAC